MVNTVKNKVRLAPEIDSYDNLKKNIEISRFEFDSAVIVDKANRKSKSTIAGYGSLVNEMKMSQWNRLTGKPISLEKISLSRNSAAETELSATRASDAITAIEKSNATSQDHSPAIARPIAAKIAPASESRQSMEDPAAVASQDNAVDPASREPALVEGKQTAVSRLAEEIDSLYNRANDAMLVGNFARAASHARALFALFQATNIANRSRELAKIIEQLEENTRDKVDTYVGMKAKVMLGLELGAAAITAVAGVAGVGGGFVGAVPVGEVIQGVGKAVAAGSQGLSYAGQAGTSATGALKGFFFESDRAALDGARQAMQTEQDDLSKKRESSQGAKRQVIETEDQIRNSRQRVFGTIAGG